MAIIGCHLHKGVASLNKLKAKNARGVVLSGWKCQLNSIANPAYRPERHLMQWIRSGCPHTTIKTNKKSFVAQTSRS